MTPDHLKPCPHCGVEDVRLTTSKDRWWVQCQSCRARGPKCADAVHAERGWNERVPQAAAA